METQATHSQIEHLDVLIVGAGLSGIGAAAHLLAHRPATSFAIVEARDAIGGTWDLFRYPGIRSDSDMFTLGYAFKPWRKPTAIANGPAILDYIRETAEEHGIEQRVRYGQRVLSAEWSSEQARWTVTIATSAGESTKLTCGFLYCNTGYYRYEEGFSPELPGRERFTGKVIHPQHWPEELDYAGRRVVVIGSGATAITLVPAMADTAAHVTMLQRSPSYVLSLPGEDPLARLLLRCLPARAAYPLMRAKNVLAAIAFYRLSRRAPRLMRRLLKRGVQGRVPADFDVARHFEPRYDPWDQRVCFVPDGDLFAALADGRAEIVTDQIETFTERGLELRSGAELEADIVVTATGLNLLMIGGIELTVDGKPVELADTVAYKGMMLSGVPNMAYTVGYTNASWTLKADLVARYVCRLLEHMQTAGYDRATPLAPPPDEPRTPLIDLASGYVLRSLGKLPTQGTRPPWRLHQSYLRDLLLLRTGSLQDEGIELTRTSEATVAETLVAAA